MQIQVKNIKDINIKFRILKEMSVINSSKLHINHITDEAIKRNCFSKYLTNKITGDNVDTLLRIYKANIRPKMEYAAIVWWRALQYNLKKFESEQNGFICYTFGVTNKTSIKDVNMMCVIDSLSLTLTVVFSDVCFKNEL